MIRRVWAVTAQKLRSQLTPGQQWTLVLALGLGIAMLVWGLPGPRVVSDVPRITQAREPATAAVDREPDPLYTPRTAAPVAPAGEDDDAPEPAPPAPGPEMEAGGQPVPGTRVVALVRPGGAPGRSEAEIARVFLSRSGVSAEVVTVEGTGAEVCRQAAAVGDFAVAGDGLATDVRSCLVAAGVRVLAYDVRGADDRTIFSTARPVAAALGEIPELGGNVGVVGSTELRREVGAGVDALRRRGIAVAAVAYVAPGAEGMATMSEAVRSFVAQDVETVVFAIPVAQQSAWVGKHSVLAPGVSFVVADAYDAVRNESYPASFDGSLAHTATRVPWFARTHGETPEQELCRTTYEGRTTPPATLGSEELVRVYQWCQHAVLLRLALDGLAGGHSLDALLAARPIASPLTSDLGVVAGRFGPAAQATLRWLAACSCWTELRGFSRRPG
jgi:hypothetical protein